MSSYAYMFHLATEEMTGRMIAAEKRVKKLEAENAELQRMLHHFIAETRNDGGVIDDQSSEGIRAALVGLFEQQADDEGEA